MSSHVQFEEIYHGSSQRLGRIRLAAVGLAWKSMDTESTVTITAENIRYMEFLRVARNFQLRIGLKGDRRRETFDGFMREDHDKIATLVKQFYSIILETKETTTKGWNWGTTDVQGGDLTFLVSNKTVFEIPLSSIANSNIAGKTEVSLEFTPQAVAAAPKSKGKPTSGPDELMEMRWFVPGAHFKGNDDEDGSGEEEEEETSAAKAFHDMIKEKAEIGQVSGDGIVTFNEILVQTPRGRYEIEMYPTFLRLRGKTYDYKIMYTSITRIFLLPKPDEIHVQLVIGLDPPIRQGQTRYPFLVIIFSRDDELDVGLNLDEETIQSKYEGRLQKKYDLPTYRVVSEVFRGLSGKKLTAPGSFASRDNQHGIKANLKAVLGELYLLEKSLIFVAKQPTVIDYADVHQIVFSRVGGTMTSARTFDLRVVTKSGAVSEITFTSINKEEHEPVEQFLMSKKLKIKNEMNEGDVLMAAPDEDSDEEMASDDSGGKARPVRISMNDDDESEEDEDFEASESDEGSPSDTDSADDGVISDASGDMDIAKAGKKASGPSKKKKKAEASGDAEAGTSKAKSKAKAGDADGDAAPKKKSKPKAPKADTEEGGSEPKTKPKPKPKPKQKEATNDEGPAKKKLKKAP